MNNLSKFCSCKNLKCLLHPTKHDDGCSPCINKNLKLKEVPNCFFDLVDGSELRSGDSFEDFVDIIQKSRS